MKFSTRADVDAPPEVAFDAFADFPRFVRLAQARGATVDLRPAPVFAWRARFSWHGGARDMTGEVTRFDRPSGYAATMTAGGLEGLLEVEVTPVDASRSRVRVTMDWRPVTLGGRLLLQSLKLVKPGLDARFAARIAEFAAGAGGKA
jgi:hypothetical protein